MENTQVNILLVEDRPENLLALEAVLTSPQYRLIKANSGIEALKWVLKEEFAVILMDVQMPLLNGFETVKMIREREKSKDIPIIFITALSQTVENVLYGYSVGAIDYIIKPFDPIVLKCKVDGFISMYTQKKIILEQKNLIASRTKELERVYTELKKKEAMSRAIGETSIDSIVFFSEDGTILSLNPTVKKMLGYSDGELVGKKVDLLFDLSISDIPTKANVETTAIRKDKTTFPIELHIADTEVEHEKIFVCTIRDITERKHYFEMLESLVKERTLELSETNRNLHNEIEEKKATMKQLYESEEKYRQLVENSPEAIIVRAVSSENISFINDTGVKLLKANSKEELVGRSMFEIVHPSDQEKARKVYKQLSRGETILPYEEKLVCVNGDVIDVQIKIIPFVYEGKASLHIVIRDMTEVKRNEEFIQQSEKLNVVGELAAGIAHEIRNPLTSLKGFTQLLEYKYSTDSDYVNIMIQEIDRINTIVSELLLLAKPGHDDFREVSLDQLIQNVTTLMSAQANLHGITLQPKMDPNLNSVMIKGVENKIKQVFINIIKNAIEASGAGGSIVIETMRVCDHIVISFTDTGVGIPKSILQNIGKPFFTTKATGTGLGIMVSKSIIESHDGEWNIRSKEGEGTTVEVKLPILKDL
ncbi:PAS domain S-box protein [Robertmurraya yapensis]|uniref:histidine kinase n=1 Tax=Bacillus yapensis TaxID=2492960 RepID=A0A431VZM1_9BACI|nr:PAS domain S-box protein [Bacillus yapensis]RTR28731.1 PAS domain S-box protein [Bacillus yapensis]TKS94588.1 PAS domain S-box protein [Bacillus yapensis]